jgi:hypothetical protein
MSVVAMPPYPSTIPASASSSGAIFRKSSISAAELDGESDPVY